MFKNILLILLSFTLVVAPLPTTPLAYGAVKQPCQSTLTLADRKISKPLAKATLQFKETAANFQRSKWSRAWAKWSRFWDTVRGDYMHTRQASAKAFSREVKNAEGETFEQNVIVLGLPGFLTQKLDDSFGEIAKSAPAHDFVFSSEAPYYNELQRQEFWKDDYQSKIPMTNKEVTFPALAKFPIAIADKIIPSKWRGYIDFAKSKFIVVTSKITKNPLYHSPQHDVERHFPGEAMAKGAEAPVNAQVNFAFNDYIVSSAERWDHNGGDARALVMPIALWEWSGILYDSLPNFSKDILQWFTDGNPEALMPVGVGEITTWSIFIGAFIPVMWATGKMLDAVNANKKKGTWQKTARPFFGWEKEHDESTNEERTKQVVRSTVLDVLDPKKAEDHRTVIIVTYEHYVDGIAHRLVNTDIKRPMKTEEDEFKASPVRFKEVSLD